MGITEPLAELAATAGLDGVLAEVGSKVVGANPTRVQAGEEPDEADEVVLLGRAGRGWVGGCDGMEQRPGAPAEGLDVGGAVGGRSLEGLCLGCPRREGEFGGARTASWGPC